MKAWDIYTWEFDLDGRRQAHPAVIVSGPDRVAGKPVVNVLKCSSQRAGRKPDPHEVLLDQADGLDWETLCACDLLWTVAKTDLKRHRGSVGFYRRQQIIARIIQAMGWNKL